MPTCKNLQKEIERREKIRQSQLGRVKSPETCERIRQAKLGIPRSPETIAKMRASKTKYTPEERLVVRRVWYNRHYQKLKMGVLGHYSHNTFMCAHCDHGDLDVLTIDHINGGGRQHVLQLRRDGTFLYRWLKNNNYPDGFQVLCANCNLKKHKEGIRNG